MLFTFPYSLDFSQVQAIRHVNVVVLD